MEKKGKKTIRHASLFSGIGGPEVAASMMGWENAFHCEINPFGRAVLDYWFPESKSYEDITKTSFKEWRGRIDVLTGGFPCQPFSYAGKRGGREDERYLWPEMLRVIGEVRPTWVVGENVAGITTMVEGGILTPLGGDSSLFPEGDELHRYELDQSFTIERICGDLERLGYSVQPVLIPAAAVGAPHRRDRVFIIAHVADADRGDDAGEAGGYEGAGRTERVQERDEVREPGIAGDVRSGGAGIIADSTVEQGGLGLEQSKCCNEEQGEFRGGSSKDGVWTPSDTDCHRGDEIHEHIQPGLADGAESFGYGRERYASHSDRTGREEPVKPKREENRPEDGTGLHDRAERPGGYGNTSDPVSEGLEGKDQSGDEETEERMHIRGTLTGCGRENLLPENRWSWFPTVSPVHRGNDGLPFDVDSLTVPPIPAPPTYGKGDPKKYPFSKWRTESLKAYGNAIVPQVMYRLFQAIEKVTLF